MGVIGHAFLACPSSSLEHFIIAFQGLPGVLTRFSPPLGRPSSSGEIHGLANRLVRAFLLEYLLGLLKAPAELVRLDLPVVNISFGR